MNVLPRDVVNTHLIPKILGEQLSDQELQIVSNKKILEAAKRLYPFSRVNKNFRDETKGALARLKVKYLANLEEFEKLKTTHSYIYNSNKPVQAAASLEKTSDALLTLIRAGKEINGWNAGGKLPLTHAVMNGNVVNVRALIKHPETDLKKRNRDGSHPKDFNKTNNAEITKIFQELEK